MKIINQDLKHGRVRIQVDTQEDAWYLSQLIDKGDFLKGKTHRKVKTSEEADSTKKTITVEIQVEKAEYSTNTTSLRVNGKITEALEDIPKGSHQSINVDPGAIITLTKQHWYSYQIDRLKEAAESSQSKILLCIFDREEAYFAIMRRKGAEMLMHLKGDVERKRMTTKVAANFYEQIIKQLQEYEKRYNLDHIIIASPSFWKEELFKELKDEQLKKKIIQATCSSADESAIEEVLKREEVSKALEKERTSNEIKLVEQALSEIAKKGAVVYGLKATGEASNAGAIQTLLITDTLIQKAREKDRFEKIDIIMKQTDKQKGKVVIISGENTGGQKLNGLGGIAAILRYRLSYE